MKQIDKLIKKFHLDRRHKYFIWDFGKGFGDEVVCYDGKFIQACSGCSDDGDYQISEQGSGCDWCGYTGKSITHFPIPIVDLKGNFYNDKARKRHERLKVKEG